MTGHDTTAVGAPICLDDGHHAVQFYDEVDDLVGVVGGYLAAAVADGNGVIVVAMPSHREAFRGALAAAGVDLDAVRSSGQLAMYDAQEMLARFTVAGSPDPAQFDAVIGGAVRDARSAAAGGAVRVYGEMVALLWQMGDVAGAIELEKLWNELAERVPFSLFCSYPARLVSDPVVSAAFDEVCGLHSHVVAAPRHTAAAQFGGVLESVRSARRFVAGALGEWNLADIVEDAVLVVSELATNAVLHAGSDFGVRLSRLDRGVRVEVFDSGGGSPQLSDSSRSGPGGRGLGLVATLSTRWGHAPHRAGKVVWVELTR